MHPFWIPSNELFADPANAVTLLRLMESAADTTRVNLYRLGMGYVHGQTSHPVVLQFVYWTHPDDLLTRDGVSIAGAKPVPADTQTGDWFLSTAAVGNARQLRSFRWAPQLDIRSMNQLHNYLGLPGQYAVQGTDQQYREFLKTLADLVGRRFSQSVTASAFEHGTSEPVTTPAAADYFAWGGALLSSMELVRVLLISITAVLVFYYGFAAAKRIGVLRMHGASVTQVWWELVGRLTTLLGLATTAIALLAALAAAGWNTPFLTAILANQGFGFGASIVGSFALLVYAWWIRFSEALKNRRDTGSALVLNTVLKVIWTVILISGLGQAATGYAQLVAMERLLKTWQGSPIVREYGVFPYKMIGYDLGSGAEFVMRRWLYPILGRQGALYVDAHEYEEPVPGVPVMPNGPGTFDTITVNTEYLRVFPIYDVDGKQIAPREVAEGTLLALVPVRYRSEIPAIRRYLELGYRGRIRVDVRVVRNQWVFTFDPAVSPKHGNRIFAPIVVVADRNFEPWGGGPTDPLKVRLVQGSTVLTNRALSPVLKRLGLDRYLPGVVTVAEAINEQVAELRRRVLSAVAVMAVLLAGGVALSAQTISVLWSRYRRRFAVRAMMGLPRWRAYQELYTYWLVVWAVQVMVGVPYALRHGSAVGPVLWATGLLLGIDGVAGWMLMVRSERRRLVEALKGEEL